MSENDDEERYFSLFFSCFHSYFVRIIFFLTNNNNENGRKEQKKTSWEMWKTIFQEKYWPQFSFVFSRDAPNSWGKENIYLYQNGSGGREKGMRDKNL